MVVIDENLSRRISVAGFVCACLVVSLHTHVECEPRTVACWLHQFMVASLGAVAVPTFFAISGFLLAGKMETSRWWPREVRKRVASLLVPYLFWNLFYLFLGMTLGSVLAGIGQTFGDAKWSDLTIGKMVSALGLNPFRGMQLPFLWFVRSLFVFVLFAPVFASVKRRWFGLTVIGLLLMFYLLLPQLLPPATDYCRVHFLKYAWTKGALFFAVGVYLRFNGHLFSAWRKVPAIIWLALGLGCFVFLGGRVGSFCSMVCMMLFLWRSLMFFRGGGNFGQLTSCSFPVFLLHSMVLTGLIGVWRILGIKEFMAKSIVAYFFQISLTIAVCVVLTIVMRRFIPKFAKIVFGGR